MPEITLSLPLALGALALILLIGASVVYFSLRAGIGGQLTEPVRLGRAFKEFEAWWESRQALA